MEASHLFERGNVFQVGGIFAPGYADIMNLDNAITYSANTSVSGTITDAANIVVNAGVQLILTADTNFEAGGAFTMDPASSILGSDHNLSISALNSSTLGNLFKINLLTLSLISGTTPVTFTSPSSSAFDVNTVKTNYRASLSRSIGSGGSTDPILIFSDSNALGGLQYISTSGLSLSYKLANNVDASETSNWNSGAGFVPLGDSTTKFTGSFDGNGYTISNLFIDRPSTANVGLFGYTNGATISNVGLLNVDITGQNQVGGLVGYNTGSSAISSAYTTGSVLGNYYVGGLIGDNAYTITNSYSTADVSGALGIGGLVGFHETGNASMTGSHATGTATGTGNDVGGLVGLVSSGTVSKSYATGAASGYNNVGGLVGLIQTSSTIANSYATGSASGNVQVGGLVGDTSSSTISNSYATGAASGIQSVGALIGENITTNVSNSYGTGSVPGSGTYIGGLIGYDNGSGTLTNNWWYNAKTSGIGNNGTATSSGHYEKASGVSDFYNSAFNVYTGSSTWDFSTIWFTPSGTYPQLR